MRSRTGLRAAAVALLASVLLAACGTTSNNASPPSPKAAKPTPLQALTLVSAKTTEAKTAKLALTVSSGMASGQAMTISAQGAVDFAARKIRMTMQTGGQKVDMVMLGTTMYMRLPGQEPQPGKPWVKLDLTALSKMSGTQLGGLTQGAGNDPTQALALLKGVSSDIQEVGAEQVRGVDTTHYKAKIDLRKAAAQQGTATRKQMAKVLEQAQVRSVPADVWIDGEGRMRKMRYVMKLRPEGAPSSVTMRFTMELFDFGTAVTIAKPPASQVTDFTKLVRGATG